MWQVVDGVWTVAQGALELGQNETGNFPSERRARARRTGMSDSGSSSARVEGSTKQAEPSGNDRCSNSTRVPSVMANARRRDGEAIDDGWSEEILRGAGGAAV